MLLTQWMIKTSFWLRDLLDLLFPKIFGPYFVLAILKSTSRPGWSKMVSSSKTHEGNSQIFFYPNGDRMLAPVAGVIQYIYSEGTKLNKTLLAIKRAVAVDKSIINPFAKYMHWPMWLYHLDLKSCEWIPLEWISGHFMRWDFSSEHIVVLLLSQVSFFSIYFLLILTSLPKEWFISSLICY